MSNYNGWTNYETWRVGLEIINDMTLEDFGLDVEFPTDESSSFGIRVILAGAMKSHVEDHIEETTEPGFARDYAMAFLENVSWRELANHMIKDAKEEAKQ